MKSKTIFTICSINYLSQATSLLDSVSSKLADYQFIIGLVDVLPDDFPDQLIPNCEIIPVHELLIPDFKSLCDRYNIVELNTAIKPYYFSYIFKKYPTLDFLIYLDPDIIISEPFIDLELGLENHDIVLTPHYVRPVMHEFSQQEKSRITYGQFNGGFLALKNTENSKLLIDWWSLKLQKQCIEDTSTGYYVDQKWLDFIPVNFDKVLIFKNPAYNVAYWNLHERTIIKKGNKYYVNGSIPLVFFHYSSFKTTADILNYEYPNKREDLLELLQYYSDTLHNHNDNLYKKYPCCYVKKNKSKSKFTKLFFTSTIKRNIKKITRGINLLFFNY